MESTTTLDSGLASATTAAAPPPAASPAAEPPTTVDAALDQHYDARAEAPAPGDTTAEAQPPAPATTEPPPPVVDPAAPIDETVTGPIPVERHKAILEKARTESERRGMERVVEALQQKYGNGHELLDRFQADTVGTVVGLFEELATDPRFAQQLRSHAARMLAQRRGNAPAAAAPAVNDVEPEADLQTQDGTLVYSAPQQAKWRAWHDRQLRQQLSEQLAPMQQWHQAQAQQQQQQQQTLQQLTAAKGILDRWAARDHFTEHKDAILTKQAELIAQRPIRSFQERLLDVEQTMADAYMHVYRTVVLPKLQQQQTVGFIEEAARKSSGSTPNPAASAPSQPRRARTIDEALDQVFAGRG